MSDPIPQAPRRGYLLLGLSLALVVALVVAAVVLFLATREDDEAVEDLALRDIGASSSAADCSPATTEPVDGLTSHVDDGTALEYADAPPAYGQHWPTWPGGPNGPDLRAFYAPEDRPQVEYLVHSLEHGNTVLWYDDSIEAGSDEYEQLEQVARKVPADDYLIVAPWKDSDGEAFPDGKHVALTHWTGPEAQQGAWQYCGAPSGAAVAEFMAEYPGTDAPEPGVPQ